jgi:colanic acid/amylovoran biosynthesis glycosyltransferase
MVARRAATQLILFMTPNPSGNLSESRSPVAAQYVVTFLKPEMLHVYRQITALRAFRPVVFCQKREHPATFPFDPVVVLPKPRTHQLRRFVQKTLLHRPITIYRSEARRLLAALHTAKARVLHIYFGHIGVHLLPLLEISDLPVVVSFHGADAQVGLDQPAHRAATRRMLTLATLLLVRSQSLAARLVELGADPAKIRLHRTGIPLDDIPFAPRETPADGAWRCVQACRLIAKKGLATSLRAFAEFAQTFPRSTFTIAGEGPLLPDLRRLADELRIADRVTFPGFLPQEKLRELYSASHLFLHPSELGPDGDQEGVPNSLLEAMASGLPILATRHGGLPEAVDDGTTGLLVAERDPTGLAHAMLTLAADRNRTRAMSAAASASVRAHFDLSHQAAILADCYTTAIDIFASA